MLRLLLIPVRLITNSMARPYFEEVQRLRNNPWIIVLIIAVAIGSLVPLIYGIYWQIGQGIPWGNEPMTDNELIGLTIFILITVIILGFMLGNLTLETRIDSDGIHYRMFPLKQRWRLVSVAEIEGYSLERHYKLFESGGIGFHRNLIKRTTSIRISGGKHLSIRLHTGQRVLLGTQSLEGVEQAMRKLMTKTEAF